MAVSGVTALRSAEIGVADLDAAAAFYTNIWGLEQVADTGDTRYFRGSGTYHHILALKRLDKAEMISVTLDAADRATVDALRGALAGVTDTVSDPADIDQPGGGYGFDFRDGENRRFRIVCDVADHAAEAPDSGRPIKLAHVVLNADDCEGSADLFTGKLGFSLRDQTRMFKFLGCNSDHHCIAFAFGGGPTLNHIAFEMPDLESVMRGAGNLRDAGHPIEWGVGRHGPGDNVFAYFVGPENFAIEYTAEIFQVDENYPVGMPEDWKWPPGRSDHWGVSPPPTDKLKEAQGRIHFA